MTCVSLLQFCLTLLLSGKMAGASDPASAHQQDQGFVSANVGDSLTLQCFYSGDSTKMYWYKQSLGHNPRLISTLFTFNKAETFHDDFKKNPRFALDTEKGKNHLKINNVSTSDSAFYYCARWNLFDVDFVDGIYVNVEPSGLNFPAFINQSASEISQTENFMTVNCAVHTGSCGGEHSVYWFRDSGESHPGLIYTQGGRNDQCEREDNTQTHTCVYNQPLKSLNLSHTGTYYCDVVACGHILFGNGTKLDIEGDEDSLVPVYVLSVASAVTTLLCVCLALLVCMMSPTDSCLCGDTPGRLSAITATKDDQTTCVNDSVWKTKKNGERGQRQATWTECVYFSVKK